LENKKARNYFFLGLKGLAMGAADVVPGVSGGTVAFITGIYEELLKTIKSVDISALNCLVKEGLPAFWKKINGNFILTLFLGIIISVLTLSRGILFLLEHFPVLIWSFFFGLILASAFVIAGEIKKWDARVIAAFLFGTSIAYLITVVSPTETTEAYWFVFLSGAIAICAMILPGISGSFILLLLGKYEFILGAVKDFKIGIIGVFAAGCISGLIAFSRILTIMFTRFRAVTIAVLSGFMVGSLNKVWPWKETISTRINSKGKEVPFLQDNVMPWRFEEIGENAHIAGALILFVIGFIVVSFFDKVVSGQLIREREVNTHSDVGA
jgi:putative membrane protein